MGETLHEINKYLDKLCELLVLFHSIIGSHLIHFFSDDQWNTLLSSSMKNDLLSIANDDLHFIPTSKLFKNESASIKNYNIECTTISLNELMVCQREFCLHGLGMVSPVTMFKESSVVDKNITDSNRKRMSSKKAHEIVNMSSLIADLSKRNGIDCIVDIGSGLGYLSSSLAIHYSLKTVAIDSSSSNILNTLKRSNNIELEWQIMNRKKDSSVPYLTKKEIMQKMEAGQCVKNKDNYVMFKRHDGHLIGITKFVDSNEDLLDIVKESQLEVCDGDFTPKILALVGLHTCGNLASNSLRSFVINPSIKVLCNVSCCYHLLHEEFCTISNLLNNKRSECKKQDIQPVDERYHCINLDPYHPTDLGQLENGFPLSSLLIRKKFSLSRNARMIATNAPQRLENNLKENLPDSLFWRAVFQVLVIDEVGANYSEVQVQRGIAEKSPNFLTYCQRSLAKIDSTINIPDEKILEYYSKYKLEEGKLRRFFLLKSSFGTIIETLILLDRLAFLHERGFEDSHIVQLFDKVISPRCYAILSFKDKIK